MSIVPLLCLLAQAACDASTGAGEDPAGSGESAGLCEALPAPDPLPAFGASEPTPLASISLEAASNTVELDTRAPFSPRRHRTARRGPCGTVGALLRAPEGLAYHQLAPTGEAPSIVDPSAGNADFALFFDTDCSPVAVRAAPGGYREWVRRGEAWTERPTGLDLSALFDGATFAEHIASDAAADGRMHLLAHVSASGAVRLLHGSRAAAPDSEWTWEELASHPDATAIFDYRFDTSGALHAVYSAQQFPCDDACDVTLYHGRLAGSTWSNTVVQPGVWGPPLDTFATDASLAIGPDDIPVIAAHFVTRVVTGSFRETELRVWMGDGSGFCEEVVATSPDEYSAGDGPNFTGVRPTVAFDDGGRVHVLFHDLAAWHDSNGWQNTQQGQIRHAVRTPDGWTVATLARQPDPRSSAPPLHSFDALQIVFDASGGGAHVVGNERVWETDSIYGMGAASLTAMHVALSP